MRQVVPGRFVASGDLRPGPYLAGAVLSTLFGIYVGRRIESTVGAFLGGLAATLAWGLLTQIYIDARERAKARARPQLQGLRSARPVVLGLGYLLVGVSPFLASESEPLGWPWAIYTVGYWVDAFGSRTFAPGPYRGPFSFLGEVIAGFLSFVYVLIAGVCVGLFLSGLPAGIAVGRTWLDYVGYLVAACGGMLALLWWFPGKATTGFDEALPVLLFTLTVSAPVGWVGYFIEVS